jgi:glycerate kinase
LHIQSEIFYMRKVVVAVDSFKGSLTSREVAEAFEEGFCSLRPDFEVVKVCVADGGEGTVEALVDTLGGEIVGVEVCDPLHRSVMARYGIVEQGRTAVIEMAAASGLPLLAAEERNPLLTSTYGTGEVILDALQRGCRRFLIGIGGSATNDAGTGLLRALGFRFLDCEGEELKGGGAILEKIATIDDSAVSGELRECEFIVACDVTNPLYGEQGAAYVFAPQKGADAAMVEQLDRGLRNFARVVAAHNGSAIATMEGAGAAGGLGGGLVALLGARLVHGVDMVLDAINFGNIVEGAELVITGEGRLDLQTVMGKAPSGVLAVAAAQGVPVVAIGGGVEWCDELRNSGFSAIYCVTPDGMSLDEAMRSDVARENIHRTAMHIAAKLI